ncbi:hypothetical protein VNO78_00118 [Psophocarpus tetragonolobus]|uniref:Uncharacterized protein n=1 Tax=Psophocarpus tetragonolobus TaxID=3891 RepID=A0AAN9T7G4_PSOTE
MMIGMCGSCRIVLRRGGTEVRERKVEVSPEITSVVVVATTTCSEGVEEKRKGEEKVLAFDDFLNLSFGIMILKVMASSNKIDKHRRSSCPSLDFYLLDQS